MRLVTVGAVAAFWCACACASAEAAVKITLAHGSAAEAATKSQLERLIASYELSRWTWSDAVVVDEQAIPHSHPVLTLHTRHRRDDDLLLSTYLHEQLHWLLTSHPQDTDAAIADLRKLYPTTPTGFPDGSEDEQGNYVHLLVVFLEWQADKAVIGELRARQAMEFWAHDHYRWIYKTVLDDADRISAVVRSHKLWPPPLPAR